MTQVVHSAKGRLLSQVLRRQWLLSAEAAEYAAGRQLTAQQASQESVSVLAAAGATTSDPCNSREPRIETTGWVSSGTGREMISKI